MKENTRPFGRMMEAAVRSRNEIPEKGASLTQQVYEKIRNAILQGEYHSGDSLVETHLAEKLSVSRTPVREALRQLELEELVYSVPHKGMVVRGVSAQDIDDIYTIRFHLEGLAARWAAERANENDLDGLRETFELMELYTRRGDFKHLAELDTRFHEELYSACKSHVLHHTLTQLHGHSAMARFYSLQTPSRAEKTLEEHRKILNALERGQGEEAARLAEAHIAQANRNRSATMTEGD